MDQSSSSTRQLVSCTFNDGDKAEIICRRYGITENQFQQLNTTKNVRYMKAGDLYYLTKQIIDGSSSASRAEMEPNVECGSNFNNDFFTPLDHNDMFQKEISESNNLNANIPLAYQKNHGQVNDLQIETCVAEHITHNVNLFPENIHFSNRYKGEGGLIDHNYLCILKNQCEEELKGRKVRPSSSFAYKLSKILFDEEDQKRCVESRDKEKVDWFKSILLAYFPTEKENEKKQWTSAKQNIDAQKRKKKRQQDASNQEHHSDSIKRPNVINNSSNRCDSEYIIPTTPEKNDSPVKTNPSAVLKQNSTNSSNIQQIPTQNNQLFSSDKTSDTNNNISDDTPLTLKTLESLVNKLLEIKLADSMKKPEIQEEEINHDSDFSDEILETLTSCCNSPPNFNKEKIPITLKNVKSLSIRFFNLNKEGPEKRLQRNNEREQKASNSFKQEIIVVRALIHNEKENLWYSYHTINKSEDKLNLTKYSGKLRFDANYFKYEGDPHIIDDPSLPLCHCNIENISYLNKKVDEFDMIILTSRYQDFLWDELEMFSTSPKARHFFFEYLVIKAENGSKALCEKIIKKIPDINKLRSRIYPGTLTDETINSPLAHFTDVIKFKEFLCLDEYLDYYFDLHPITRYTLEFCEPKNDEENNYFEIIKQLMIETCSDSDKLTFKIELPTFGFA